MIQRRQAEGVLNWTFPSGKIGPGESDFSAAERETLEETGIVVHAFQSLGERPHPDTGRTVTYVLCDYRSGAPTISADEADKIAAVCWMPAVEILSTVKSDFYPPVKQLISEASLCYACGA